MLGYRLLVEVTADRASVEKLALEQVHAWLREKDLDADALRESRVVPLADHADGLVLATTERDGSRRVRTRLIERTRAGTWVTELTLEVPANDSAQAWLLVEVDGPIAAKRPRLVPRLLEVLSARQGSVDYALAPHIVEPGDLDALVVTILDPDRRSLLFVAGSSSDLPLAPWREHVAKLLSQTVGLAAGYVLDPVATALLPARLGINHSVPPWTLRTFRPGVRPAEPLDARRHRVLSTDRIIRDRATAIAGVLGRRASEVSLAVPLPLRAERVDRLFRQEINALLAGLGGSVFEVERTSALPSGAAVLPEPLVAAAGALVGHVHDEQQLINRLLGLAEQGLRSEESARRLGRELEGYEQRTRELEDSQRDLKDKLLDTQLDQLELTEQLARFEHVVRDLREKLTSVGAAEQAWTEPAEELRPQSYPDLLALLPEFEHVVFTGDESVLLDLERHDQAGIWADRIWQIACTLEDYAACIHDGRFEGSLDMYLAAGLPGCRTYSGKHASDETPTVQKTKKYSRPRTFPVPEEIDPSGTKFMGAHFTIAQYGMTSPRLHYLNDARGATGRIYIGYAGPHLPSPRTN